MQRKVQGMLPGLPLWIPISKGSGTWTHVLGVVVKVDWPAHQLVTQALVDMSVHAVPFREDGAFEDDGNLFCLPEIADYLLVKRRLESWALPIDYGAATREMKMMVAQAKAIPL